MPPETKFEESDERPCLTQRVLAAHSDWHLLVGCLLLNQTARWQARPALEQLFRVVPTPEAAAALTEGADLERLRPILEPCGLLNRRFRAIKEMSEDYVAYAARPDARKLIPVKLRWVGQYAVDSYHIFINGAALHPEDVQDPELRAWLEGWWQGLWDWRAPSGR